jgi:tRNA-specific 2-thiouridylase
MKKKVLLGMSGGIDSTVSAMLLLVQGYEVVGATMNLYDPGRLGVPDVRDVESNDLEDARSVANRLGIAHHVLDFGCEFENNVVRPFAQAYADGLTANPCIACNRHLKFDLLMQKAFLLGCDHISTGHYARVEYDEARGRYLLKRAADPVKDQTYMLYTLSQEQLSHVELPLGNYTKEQVRQIAEEAGLVNSRKRDSQDICFVQSGTYADFIERYTGKKYPEGDFVDMDGKVLGRHKGVIRYTIGQRKGLGIAFGKPTYVCAKDAVNNTVTLGSNEDLFRRELTAHGINLIALPRIDTPLRVQAKVRYAAKPAAATVEQTSDDSLRLLFDEPQRAISSGQSVVLYDGNVVVGGGIID